MLLIHKNLAGMKLNHGRVAIDIDEDGVIEVDEKTGAELLALNVSGQGFTAFSGKRRPPKNMMPGFTPVPNEDLTAILAHMKQQEAEIASLKARLAAAPVTAPTQPPAEGDEGAKTAEGSSEGAEGAGEGTSTDGGTSDAATPAVGGRRPRAPRPAA